MQKQLVILISCFSLLLTGRLFSQDSSGVTKVYDIYTAWSQSKDAAAYGGYIFVAAGDDGLRLFKYNQYGGLLERPMLNLPYSFQALSIGGNVLYAACGGQGLAVYDINEPENPLLLSALSTEGNCLDLEFDTGYLYLANDGDFKCFNVADPSNPTLAAVLLVSCTVLDGDQGLFLTAGGNTAFLIDANIPNQPTIAHQWNFNRPVQDVRVGGNLAFIAESQALWTDSAWVLSLIHI